MTTVNIPHGSFPTFDLMLLETLKEKAEFEEPSSQRRDTSDLAGQPVAISLVGKVIVKERFVGCRGEEGYDEIEQNPNENFGKFKSKTIKVRTLYPVALHGRTAWESY